MNPDGMRTEKEIEEDWENMREKDPVRSSVEFSLDALQERRKVLSQERNANQEQINRLKERNAELYNEIQVTADAIRPLEAWVEAQDKK